MITGLAHCGYTVGQLEPAVAFFSQTLGVEHTHMQVSDQPYLARVTGLPGTSLKVGFVQIEDDRLALELLDFVQPRGRPAGVGYGRPGTCYVGWAVDDLQVIYQRLRRQGVTFLAEPQPVDFGPWAGGLATLLLGPDGILIELIETMGSAGPQGRLKRVHHITFTVNNLVAALSFLRGGLGLAVVAQEAADSAYARRIGGRADGRLRAAYLTVPGSDCLLEVLAFDTPAGPPADSTLNNPGSVHCCLLVDDIQADYRALSQYGARFAGPPVEVTAGVNRGAYAVHFGGPDNMRFELFQGPPTRLGGH